MSKRLLYPALSISALALLSLFTVPGSPAAAGQAVLVPQVAGELCALSAGTAAAEEGLGDIQELYHCTVTYTQCYGGTSISCTGHLTCSSGLGWVECDGERTYCPPCTVSCWDPSRTCTSQVGDCEIWGSPSDPYQIRCDDQVIFCP